MATVFEHGGLILVTPVNGSDPLYNFGLEVSYNPPEQMVQRWGWIAQHGMNIKKLGTGGKSGVVNGFLDAESLPQLATGTSYLEQKVKDSPPETALFASETIASCLLTRIEWVRFWSYTWGGVERYCASFILYWEAP